MVNHKVKFFCSWKINKLSFCRKLISWCYPLRLYKLVVKLSFLIRKNLVSRSPRKLSDLGLRYFISIDVYNFVSMIVNEYKFKVTDKLWSLVITTCDLFRTYQNSRGDSLYYVHMFTFSVINKVYFFVGVQMKKIHRLCVYKFVDLYTRL